MKKYTLNIKAFWFQPEIGKHGYFGAILESGNFINFCSYESYILGCKDSIHYNLEETIQKGYFIYEDSKTCYHQLSENLLLKENYNNSTLILTVPENLQYLLKK